MRTRRRYLDPVAEDATGFTPPHLDRIILTKKLGSSRIEMNRQIIKRGDVKSRTQRSQISKIIIDKNIPGITFSTDRNVSLTLSSSLTSPLVTVMTKTQ
jgi:hypothetical protein